MIGKMKGKQLFSFINVVKKNISDENISKIVKYKFVDDISEAKKDCFYRSSLVCIFPGLIIHPGFENGSFLPAYNHFHIRLFPQLQL